MHSFIENPLPARAEKHLRLPRAQPRRLSFIASPAGGGPGSVLCVAWSSAASVAGSLGQKKKKKRKKISFRTPEFHFGVQGWAELFAVDSFDCNAFEDLEIEKAYHSSQ